MSLILSLFIYFLIAYASRCVMALVHALKGLCPCPKCLILQDKLSDFTEKYDLCTSEGTQKIFEEAGDLSATAKDSLLKKYGLCDVWVGVSYCCARNSG